MKSETKISERRACILVGIDRLTFRYQPQIRNDAALRERMRKADKYLLDGGSFSSRQRREGRNSGKLRPSRRFFAAAACLLPPAGKRQPDQPAAEKHQGARLGNRGGRLVNVEVVHAETVDGICDGEREPVDVVELGAQEDLRIGTRESPVVGEEKRAVAFSFRRRTTGRPQYA